MNKIIHDTVSERLEHTKIEYRINAALQKQKALIESVSYRENVDGPVTSVIII